LKMQKLNTEKQEIYSNELNNLYLGESELATRIREYDWSRTELGPINRWPQSFRVALSICLTTRFPMFIWWGKELIYFYNDAYISFLGHKHPSALGQCGRKIWPEVLPVIEPMIEHVFSTKTASWSEDIVMFISRALPLEEVYVTFSFSPIFDENNISGILCACTETTQKLVNNRRLETLRILSMRAAAQTADEACRKAALVLTENLYDISFSAIYTINNEETLQLKALSGLQGINHPFIACINLGEEDTSIWCLKKVFSEQSKEQINLEEVSLILPGGPWSEPSQKAIVLPILSANSVNAAGCLILGVNPRRVLDKQYLSFFDLVARHIGIAIADAQAYEIECKRAEELAKIDRAKTIFFSNVSHEFRTPLTLILGPIEDVLEKFSELNKSEIHSYLKPVHRNALRLLKLVNTL
jgi:GAF domain-containing protein